MDRLPAARNANLEIGQKSKMQIAIMVAEKAHLNVIH